MERSKSLISKISCLSFKFHHRYFWSLNCFMNSSLDWCSWNIRMPKRNKWGIIKQWHYRINWYRLIICDVNSVDDQLISLFYDILVSLKVNNCIHADSWGKNKKHNDNISYIRKQTKKASYNREKIILFSPSTQQSMLFFLLSYSDLTQSPSFFDIFLKKENHMIQTSYTI